MQQLNLPESVATKAQLLALRKNLNDVLETITQNRVRLQEEVDVQPAPEVSGSLASLLKINKLEPSAAVLAELKKWVEYLLHHAPVVRLTLSAEPGPKDLALLIRWFRQESQKIVLMNIGIQPTIAGGLILRTPSHRYDMTLRKQLLSRTDTFIEAVTLVSERADAAQQTQEKAVEVQA